MTKPEFIRFGFIAGFLANLGGVLLATESFTSPVVARYFPGVFSDFGMWIIILWGLAYLAVSRHYAAVPWVVAVFALEKAGYVVSWCWWMQQNSEVLRSVFQDSLLAGMFYAVYGANDFAFGLFFAWVFWTTRRSPS
jgi:hypothetical protein